MRFIVVGFMLSVFAFSLGIVEVNAQVSPQLPVAPVQPQDGAESIELTLEVDPVTNEEFLALLLEWGPSPAPVDGYRYQYWKLGDLIPSPGTQEFSVVNTQGLVSASALEPGAKYFWRVRACTDIGGCGPYNNPSWSFAFLLPPPEITDPTSGSISLPVEFSWNPVVGAESYFIRGEIDFSDPWWNTTLDVVNDPGGWFFRWGLNKALELTGLAPDAVKCPFGLWDETDNNCVELLISQGTPPPPTTYTDNDCLFTIQTKYRWQIASCLDNSLDSCGPSIKNITFSTNDTYNGTSGFTLPAPILLSPFYNPAQSQNIPVVGFTDVLSWDSHSCTHYQKVTLTRESDGTKIEAIDIRALNLDRPQEEALPEELLEVRNIWDELDTVYSWQVHPCRIKNNENIDCDDAVSTTWKFKTTGAIPQNSRSEITDTVKLFWDEVKKAGVYTYQLAKDAEFSALQEGRVFATTVTLSYPDVKPATKYWWRVTSCADEKGEICGSWTTPQSFTTLPLNPPTNPNPKNKDKFFLPGQLSWQADPGASYYRYHVEYWCKDQKETLEECPNIPTCDSPTANWEPAVLIDERITSNTSFYLSSKCAGKYRWAVASCADKDCGAVAPDNPTNVVLWTFTAIPHPSPGAGLVPCGRIAPNDTTPYDERESCQFKHIGFLLQNILDFVLWKLSLIVLAALAVFVAASAYFSFGSPDTLTRIRAMFRSYLYGVLYLVFAWAIVNITMAVFGFSINFFGRWYELPF